MPFAAFCRACDSREVTRTGEERCGAELFELFTCADCQSISLFPDPTIDYTSHTGEDLTIKHYLELNASIDWMAVNVMSAIADRPSGRLLDIGCGFGFSADAAKRLAGWDVVGVEPSNYGRLGAKALGLNIIPDFIDAQHPVARQRFDVIHASEVIEHIVRPKAFLIFLKSMLQAGGTLVLTTPDADALEAPISDSQRRAMLSIGAHVVLFTQRSLARILEGVGFPHVRIDVRGATLVAFASESPIRLASPEPARIGLAYCDALLAVEIADDYLAAGILFRRFRHLIELGDYATAAGLVHIFDDAREPQVPCRDAADFASRYRMFAGVALFYVGILDLNFRRDIEAARDAFRRSNLICAEKVRVLPESSVFDQNIMWRSLLHVAICDEMLGDIPRCKNIHEKILSADVGIDVNVPGDILDASKQAYARLGGNIDAFMANDANGGDRREYSAPPLARV